MIPEKVQSTPDFILLGRTVIPGEMSSPAKRAVILMPGIRASLDPKVCDTIHIIVEIVRFYNCVLDIEKFLHKVSVEAILILLYR